MLALSFKSGASERPALREPERLGFETHPVPKSLRKAKDVLVVTFARQLPSIPEKSKGYTPLACWATHLIGQAEGTQVVLLYSRAETLSGLEYWPMRRPSRERASQITMLTRLDRDIEEALMRLAQTTSGRFHVGETLLRQIAFRLLFGRISGSNGKAKAWRAAVERRSCPMKWLARVTSWVLVTPAELRKHSVFCRPAGSGGH